MSIYIFKLIRILVCLLFGVTWVKPKTHALFLKAEPFLEVIIKALFLVAFGFWLTHLFIIFFFSPFSYSQWVMVGLQVLNGNPLYTSLSDPHCYSMLYGPIAYLVNSLYLLLPFEALFSCKLGGLLLFLISTLILLRIVWKKIAPNNKGAFLIFVFLQIWVFSKNIWWINDRPDNTIYFGLVLLCVSLYSSRSWMSILWMSLGCLIIANTKIHGSLYCLPFLYLFFKQRGWKDCLWSVCGAFFGSLLLFLIPGISLTHYMQLLLVMKNHNLIFLIWLRNALFSLELLFPLVGLVCFLFYKREKEATPFFEYKGMFWVILLASMGGVGIFGAKLGSDLHHLIHFSIIIGCIIAELLHKNQLLKAPLNWSIQIKAGDAPKWRYFQSGTLCLFLILSLMSALAMGSYVWVQSPKIIHQFPVYREVERECLTIMQKYPAFKIGIAPGSAKSFIGPCLASCRPLVYTTYPDYYFDNYAFSDIKFAKVPFPKSSNAIFSNQIFDILILPKSETPFGEEFCYEKLLSGKSVPLYPIEFQNKFKENYVLKESFTYTDVWIAKKNL